MPAQSLYSLPPWQSMLQTLASRRQSPKPLLSLFPNQAEAVEPRGYSSATPHILDSLLPTQQIAVSSELPLVCSTACSRRTGVWILPKPAAKSRLLSALLLLILWTMRPRWTCRGVTLPLDGCPWDTQKAAQEIAVRHGRLKHTYWHDATMQHMLRRAKVALCWIPDSRQVALCVPRVQRQWLQRGASFRAPFCPAREAKYAARGFTGTFAEHRLYEFDMLRLCERPFISSRESRVFKLGGGGISGRIADALLLLGPLCWNRSAVPIEDGRDPASLSEDSLPYLFFLSVPLSK